MENHKEKIDISLTTGLGLLIFGIAYAYRIAHKPFRPGWTWVSVVIGDAVTDAGAFLLIYTWSRNLWLALIPFLAHILTGLPMIVGQEIKKYVDRREEQAYLETYHNGEQQ